MKMSQALLRGAAVIGLLALPVVAQAQGVTTNVTLDKTYTEDVTVDLVNYQEVELIKKVDVTKDLDFIGTVVVSGNVDVNQSAMAVVDNKQVLDDNTVTLTPGAQEPYQNDVTLTETVLQGATGNIGVNLAAGDNNAQDNATAIAAIFGSAGSVDAEDFSMQKAVNNQLNAAGEDINIDNQINVGQDVLRDAAGNLGLNIAAGTFNAQKNVLAIASVTGEAVLAEASAGILQQATFNNSQYTEVQNLVAVNGSVARDASGNIGVNFAAGSGNLQHNSLSIANVQ